jgi:hypothetical protein
MKEGLYEIVGMRRSTHGKWVFTARPVHDEISFECNSDALEEALFMHAREPLWLSLKESNPCVLDYFDTKGLIER